MAEQQIFMDQAYTSNKSWIYGGIGVLIFAGSLPMTQLAVNQLNPWLVTGLRGVIAGAIALILLKTRQQPIPTGKQWKILAVIAAGVVLGFPLLTALALQYVSSAHSVVFLGLLPLCTSLFSALREKHIPGPLFWCFAVVGSACVVGYAISQITATSLVGDALMLAAIITCGLGYAEGAALSRKLGGWQVICWALVVSLPVLLPLTVVLLPAAHLQNIHFSTIAGLVYVTLFSMLIGFFFWYQGLALGDTAKISQLQLLQPFIALGLSALIMGDTINSGMLMACVGALLCVVGIRRYG